METTGKATLATLRPSTHEALSVSSCTNAPRSIYGTVNTPMGFRTHTGKFLGKTMGFSDSCEARMTRRAQVSALLGSWYHEF